MHLGKGQGVNKKTGKPNDLWKCGACDKVCGDNRACCKHFRNKHLSLFIHYCPVEGCTEGSDQKDTIIGHIMKTHSDQKELVEKCKKQKFLKCRKCFKQFISVKGKNAHEVKCGEPVVKLKCPYQHCFKAYKMDEKLQDHIKAEHEGKGHKCLCPVCGKVFITTQGLEKHLKNQHNQ